MSSPITSVDLKLSLMDRVSRNLSAEAATETAAAAHVATQDADSMELCGYALCLDTALIDSPQQAVNECGDMEVTAAAGDHRQSKRPSLTIDNLQLPFDSPQEPPIEERIRVEDFDLPFDNNNVSEAVEAIAAESQPRISLEDLHLPFDEPACSPAHVTVPSQPKRNRRRRQSADFQIATAKVSISPDVQLPEAPPTGRRSSRLRRKSTELYRNHLQVQIFEPPAPELQHSVPDCSEVREDRAGAGAESIIPETVPQQAGKLEDLPCVDMLQALQDVHVSREQQAMEAEEEEENIAPIENHAEAAAMQVDDASQAKRKPRSKRKCTLINKEEARTTPPKRRRTSPKKAPAPCIEDIYRNRLWRTEMPTEKIWETIYEEEPKLSIKDKAKNTKPQKRVLDPDEFHTYSKLKRRRNKAMKQGWKPLSKKRLQKAETLLLEKLSIFEHELETDESSMGSFKEADAQSSLDTFGDHLKDLQISMNEGVLSALPDADVVNMDSEET